MWNHLQSYVSEIATSPSQSQLRIYPNERFVAFSQLRIEVDNHFEQGHVSLGSRRRMS